MADSTNQQPMSQNRYGRSSHGATYPKTPTWCPGCGNYGIWGAIKLGIKASGVAPENMVMVYDVGCSGNMADFNEHFGFHSLHGRALPAAAGIKLANHNLKVLVVIGDGGCYGEGGTHFINLMRGNHDITVMVHDNHRYSLTTGQMSPTTDKGTKTKSTPEGTIEEPFNPIGIALTNHASFIAREFAGDIPGLGARIGEAINHSGFSLIDVLQPCTVFNPEQGYDWYREHMVKLADEGYEMNKEAGWKQAMRSEKLPVGLFWKEDKPAYHQQVATLNESSLVDHDKSKVDISVLKSQFI